MQRDSAGALCAGMMVCLLDIQSLLLHPTPYRGIVYKGFIYFFLLIPLLYRWILRLAYEHLVEGRCKVHRKYVDDVV